MTRILAVWWGDAVVGTLQVNQHGEMRFAYASAWLADAYHPAISFSMPKRAEPYKQRHCRPFFAGLLPEESQRDAIAGALGISTRNDFAFLEALGGDVAGALALCPKAKHRRYDRRIDEDGRAHRLHQEDFCQALGIPPEWKYASEDGPTFTTSFDLLRRATTVPAVAVLALLDAVIYNLIVGNADAHGKNFSLLYHAGAVSLAPCYDLLSTVAYPALSPTLAMKIAKRATLEEIGPATWPAFAHDIGLAGPFVRRRVTELAEAVRAQAPSIPDRPALAGLDRDALRRYSALIVARAERVARTGAAPAPLASVTGGTDRPATKGRTRKAQ